MIVSLVIVHPLKAQKEYETESSSSIKVEVAEMCSLSAARMEEKYGIKEHLLQTISSVETGRWNDTQREIVSWPWTINVNGKGYYFNTKEEAVAKVKQLQEKGIHNIDVGCMQINLKYHGKAFKTIEEALDPDTNVEYSAKFLTKLYNRCGDWQKAAMDYHSKIPSRGLKYKKRLLSRFEQIKVAVLETEKQASLF